MNTEDFKNFNYSVFSAGSECEGNFKLKGDTFILGTIKGSITTDPTCKVILERTAYLEGEIHCHDLEVFGEVQGSIISSGIVTVRSSAHISGSLKAQSLKIFPGATLNIEGHTSEE